VPGLSNGTDLNLSFTNDRSAGEQNSRATLFLCNGWVSASQLRSHSFLTGVV
jgi:hypothetical protein